MLTLTERLAAARRAFWAPLIQSAPAVEPATDRAAGSAADAVVRTEDDDLLAARADAARQRLRAEEAEAQAAALRRELGAEREGRARAVAAGVSARLDPILGDAASLLGQLALQAALIDEGKPITARDVMALAQGLARTFERLGLVPLAAPGQRAIFDPEQHRLLVNPPPPAGAVVAVRVPGYRFGERIVCKSLVESM